jgi:hypothetical protein
MERGVMSQAFLQTCNRPLTEEESKLIEFALSQEHVASGLRAQKASLRVIGHLANGLPEIYFTADALEPTEGSATEIIADFYFKTETGLGGFFVYAVNGNLAGAKCWSMDGITFPKSWPSPAELRALNFPALADFAALGC